MLKYFIKTFFSRAVTVERDQLKEQLAQLERDNRQLTFENETLLYSLRQRSFTISKMNVHTKPRPTSTRAHSSSSMTTTTTEHDRVKRSVSLNCIYNR
jgi:regulator of replication initiation timing